MVRSNCDARFEPIRIRGFVVRGTDGYTSKSCASLAPPAWKATIIRGGSCGKHGIQSLQTRRQMPESTGKVTLLPARLREGHQEASNHLVPLVCAELRRMAGAYMQ